MLTNVPYELKKGPYGHEKRSLYTLFFIPKGLWGLQNNKNECKSSHFWVNIETDLFLNMSRYNVKYDTCNSFGIKLQFFFLLLLWFWNHIFVIKNYFGHLLKKFSQHGIYMAMKGCISVLRVGAQKSVRVFLKSPKIIGSS